MSNSVDSDMEKNIGGEKLTQILADARGQAAVLRRHGHAEQADALEELCDKVDEATEDFRTFISEADAQLRSGWSAGRLRRHFAQWAEEGHAEMRRRIRYYRRLIVPRRPDLAAAREAGRRGGQAA